MPYFGQPVYDREQDFRPESAERPGQSQAWPPVHSTEKTERTMLMGSHIFKFMGISLEARQ